MDTYLLDAMGMIHRAYHASVAPGKIPMRTRAGLHTGCVYIFNNMLKSLRLSIHGAPLVACCDLPGPTWQDEEAKAMPALKRMIKDELVVTPYLGYKAGRPDHTEDFLEQIPYIYRLFAAYGIPVAQLEGFEADDVIATLASRIINAAPQQHVYVVCSDKDLMQLAFTDSAGEPRVMLKDPSKGALSRSTMTRGDVLETMGVLPEQLPDVFALRGDTADNIPGCPGIGDKGSVELIQQFKSIENLLANLDKVQKKAQRVALELNGDAVRLSKKLFTLRRDVPIDTSFEFKSPDDAALAALFLELEFGRTDTNFVRDAIVTDEPKMDLDFSEAM